MQKKLYKYNLNRHKNTPANYPKYFPLMHSHITTKLVMRIPFFSPLVYLKERLDHVWFHARSHVCTNIDILEGQVVTPLMHYVLSSWENHTRCPLLQLLHCRRGILVGLSLDEVDLPGKILLLGSLDEVS